MAWGINCGFTSCSSTGNRAHTSAGHFSDTKKKKQNQSIASGTNKRHKLTDEEVRMIRELDASAAMSRKQIYNTHVADKMTFPGMCLILDYITRTKGLSF